MKLLVAIYKASFSYWEIIELIAAACEKLAYGNSITFFIGIGKLDNISHELLHLNHNGIKIQFVRLYREDIAYFRKMVCEEAVMSNFKYFLLFSSIYKIDWGGFAKEICNSEIEEKVILIGSKDGSALTDLFKLGIIRKLVGNDFALFFSSSLMAIPVKYLDQIPFKLLSDGDISEVELRLQLRQLEVPFVLLDHSHCDFPSFKYVLQLAKEIAEISLSKRGLYYQELYDVETDNRFYPLKLGFPSSHSMALRAIRPNESILDIGSGPYPISHQLVGKGHKVVTVDQYPPIKTIKGSQYIVHNLDDPFTIDATTSDVILLLDIVEHLSKPEKFLRELADQFTTDKQTLILTTGNIAFFPLRIMLLIGKFNYGKRGILDMTHTRLYTFKTFRTIIERSGMEIVSVKGIPVPFPMAFGDNMLSRTLLFINQALIRISKPFFSFQIYVEARSRPSSGSQIKRSEKEQMEFLLQE